MLSILQPRRAPSVLCAPWGPWGLFLEAKQSRDEDCQAQVGPKLKTTTSKVRTAKRNRRLQVIEILSILQPRGGPSVLCALWGPSWRYREGKQSRNEDCQAQVGPKIKTTTSKARRTNHHRPFQVIEILSIVQPSRAPSSLCAPWGPLGLFLEAKQFRDEDCLQQVGPKIKIKTTKVRTANHHRPFQVIEILSIILPRRTPSTLSAACGPW
jgi:hypothetical protein